MLKLVFLFMLLSMPLPVKAADLPFPKALKKDVRFWELVLGRYGANECVLHDMENLGIIYGVKRLSGTGRKRDRAIHIAREQVEKALFSLSRRGRSDSKVEAIVEKAIPPKLRTKRFFYEARSRVRCQVGVADSMRISIEKSRSHVPLIKKIFKKHGLPADLAYLPHLESGFQKKAHSKVGARGLWQLMPADARAQGLQVNRWRDERLLVAKSTGAAAKILRRNYDMVSSWPLALTGYNYGINGVKRGIRRLGTTDFMKFRLEHDSPSFGFASRNFYPSFLAAVRIARRTERDGMSAMQPL